MNARVRYLLLVLAMAISSFPCVAAGVAEHDTVFFYDTWKELLNKQPVAVVVDPDVITLTPYEVYIDTGIDETNELIMENHMACSLGDSIMLVNGEYLQKHFKGKTSNLRGFIPICFNDRLAFITCNGNVSLDDVLQECTVDYYDKNQPVFRFEYWYIDFVNKKIERVNSKYLSRLLGDYHDLLMRYEGMRDYKKQYVIDEFFFEFVDRAAVDVMRPSILNYVE